MKKRQSWLFFIIFLVAFSIYLLVNYPFQLGLDLRGGSQLTLELIKEDGNINRDELDSVKAVLDKRVNNLGVSESNLQTLGSNQLVLELPGEQDPLAASRVIGKTALLEFRTQTSDSFNDLKKLQFQRLQINNLIDSFNDLNKRSFDKNLKDKLENSLGEIEESLNYKSNESELFLKLNETRKFINLSFKFWSKLLQKDARQRKTYGKTKIMWEHIIPKYVPEIPSL